MGHEKFLRKLNFQPQNDRVTYSTGILNFILYSDHKCTSLNADASVLSNTLPQRQPRNAPDSQTVIIDQGTNESESPLVSETKSGLLSEKQKDDIGSSKLVNSEPNLEKDTSFEISLPPALKFPSKGVHKSRKFTIGPKKKMKIEHSLITRGNQML